MQLQINPVFAEVIPELTLDEFAQLEENILAEKRIIDPIITWKGFIVDGHNRYKIAQKYPDIPYSTHEKEFENEDEAVVWICSHQLGRRNINEIQRKCLVASRYRSEMKLERFHGNQHTLANECGLGPKGPDHKHHGTRSELAQELGVTEKYIRNSVEVLNGVDAAEEAVPGSKHEIISGQIKAFEKDIKELAKLPVTDRVEAIERMRNPATFQSREKEPELDGSVSQLENMPPQGLIEDNILGSMQGSVDLFISTYNNYFIRFPKLKEDKHYRKKAVEILKNLKKYIETVEGELK